MTDNTDNEVLGKVVKLDETTIDVPLEKTNLSTKGSVASKRLNQKGEREGVQPPAKKVRTEKQIQQFETAKKIRAEKIEQRKLEKMKILIEKGMIQAVQPTPEKDDDEEEEEVVIVKKKKETPKKKKKVIIVESESESEESEEEVVSNATFGSKVSAKKAFKSQRNKKTKVVNLEQVKPEPKIVIPKNYFAD